MRTLAFSSLFAAVAMGATSYDSETKQTYLTWQMPGISVSSPTGFGAQWGQVFAGGGFVNRNRNGSEADGGLGFGAGLGDPRKYVGFETSVSITDTSGFERGGLSLKLHRALPYNFGISVGRENTAIWGPNNDASATNYASVTRVFFVRPENQWFSAYTLTLGVGDGRFRTLTQTAQDSGVNVFGSAAVRMVQPIAIITEWSGQDLNVGASVTPFRKLPIFINPTLLDLTRNAGDSTRFSLSAGMAYSFI